MKHIKDLENKMNATKEELRKAWYAIFDDSLVIKKAMEGLEQSCNYEFNECGDIERWYSVNFPFPSESVEFLNDYLNDKFCAYYTEPRNGQNGYVSQIREISGEYYLLDNESRKVFYNNKEFLDYNNFEDKKDLFNAIEENMEKEGVFPGVYVQLDRYGSIAASKEYLENKNRGVK